MREGVKMAKDETSAPIYFVGCWDRPGHFLHAPSGRNVDQVGPFDVWGQRGYPIDGYFALATTAQNHRHAAYQDETLAALTHVKGWSILAMWDRTVDSRGACNAAFIAEGEHTHAEMWALARQHFPQIVQRLKAAPYRNPVPPGPVQEC